MLTFADRLNAHRRLSRFLLFAPLLLALAPPVALAQPTATSYAYGESISVKLLPLLGSPIQINSGPFPAVFGANPSARAQAASVGVAAPALGTMLQTGILTATATSMHPTTGWLSADAVVDGARANVVGGLPLFWLGADTLHSSAQISGFCYFEPTASGWANLTNAAVGGPLGLGLSVPLDPPPNTVLLQVAGIRVVLNEQTFVTTNYFNSVAVNALHITLNALPVSALGVLSGDIILAHSEAVLACPLIE
ncbi:MAG TPA: choice-of-anchor P family protein [Thermoanaerobaculia bacterium]|nr:choice-of-anchor P family protein [Thermoanaerobaculia bacterium]